MMPRDFADTFVAFARNEVTQQEMDEAVKRLDADIIDSYKAPVKFSAEGTPFVDSSVSAISPRRLLALIRAQMEAKR